MSSNFQHIGLPKRCYCCKYKEATYGPGAICNLHSDNRISRSDAQACDDFEFDSVKFTEIYSYSCDLPLRLEE